MRPGTVICLLAQRRRGRGEGVDSGGGPPTSRNTVIVLPHSWGYSKGRGHREREVQVPL